MYISPQKNVHAIHAFVIDADEAVRESLCELLDASGFAPQAYGTADDFIAAQPNVEGACLVLAPCLPPRTTAESFACGHGQIFSAPITVVAGRGDPSRHERTLRNGVVSYLEKPVDSHTFLALLRAGRSLSP